MYGGIRRKVCGRKALNLKEYKVWLMMYQVTDRRVRQPG